MTVSGRNEASTRTELIDTQLARAGWSRNRRTLVEEFLLKAAEPDSAYGSEQFADYVLLGSDGKPITVVEAKRSARAWLTDYRDSLVDSEPHFEVHQVLCAAMLEPARLAAWHSELGLVS